MYQNILSKDLYKFTEVSDNIIHSNGFIEKTVLLKDSILIK